MTPVNEAITWLRSVVLTGTRDPDGRYASIISVWVDGETYITISCLDGVEVDISGCAVESVEEAKAIGTRYIIGDRPEVAIRRGRKNYRKQR